MDVAGAQYADVKAVDLQQTVSDFKRCWMPQAKLDVDPSRVTLRLVACGARKPSAAEEAAAAELDDPSLTLAEAGVTGTAWLLAVVAGALGAVRPRVSRERIDADERGACSRRRARRAARGVHCRCVFCVVVSCRRALTPPHGRDAAG